MFFLYPNLFAYLNGRKPLELEAELAARDRPVIALDNRITIEPLLRRHHVVAAAVKGAAFPGNNVAFELAFPYLQPTDNLNKLQRTWDLPGGQIRIADAVVDGAGMEWEPANADVDDTVALMLQNLINVFANLGNTTAPEAEIALLDLPKQIATDSVGAAHLPLVVSLNRRYKLHRNLEMLLPTLQHQLRRRAELMPVGKIQELDAYSLRDYIRRPGKTGAEKAGEKQELMAVNRYQDYHTAENKFLLYFAKILRWECSLYEKSRGSHYRAEVTRLRHLTDSLQSALEKRRSLHLAPGERLPKPNQVLLKHPLYNRVYKAYLDYRGRAREKAQLWPYRNQLLAEAVGICLLAAVVNLPGARVAPEAKLICSRHPDGGRYLLHDVTWPEIPVLVDGKICNIRVSKPTADEPCCDWLLRVEVPEKGRVVQLPIWVFWYSPNAAAVSEAEVYLRSWSNYPVGLLFYLQERANSYSETGDIGQLMTGKIWPFQLPGSPGGGGWGTTLDFLKEVLQRWLWLIL